MSEKTTFDFDRSFQGKILRALYTDHDFQLTVSSYLNADLFESKVHKWVARTIFQYVKTYGLPITKDGITNNFRRALQAKVFKGDDVSLAKAFLSKLDRPLPHRDAIKDEVFNFVKHQDMKTRILDMVTALEKHNWKDIDRLMLEGQTVQNLGFGTLGHFYVKDKDQRLERRRLPKAKGLPTGIPGVDPHLKARGVERKTLNVIIAPPGKGKTFCLVHLGRSAVLHGFKVLHVTINEISEEKCADRYDAAFAAVNLSDLEDKKYRKRVWKNTKAVGKKYGECLVIKEFASVSVAGLEAYIKLLGNTTGFVPDVILVDYADLIQPAHRYDKKYEELGDTYVDLRSLAKKLNVAMWTASQTTRDSVNKPVVTMQDLAESFKKAWTADFLLALCYTRKEKTRRRARFYFGKSRYGASEFEVGPVRVDFGKQRMLAA